MIVGMLSFLATSTASAMEPVPETEASKIKKQCVVFFSACKNGDLDAAKQGLAKMRDEVPEEYVLRQLRTYRRLSVPEVGEMGPVRIVDGKAVIPYWESPTDLDPLYFACENGKWKILLELTTYRDECFDWTTNDLTAFSALETWFGDFSRKKLYNKDPR